MNQERRPRVFLQRRSRLFFARSMAADHPEVTAARRYRTANAGNLKRRTMLPSDEIQLVQEMKADRLSGGYHLRIRPSTGWVPLQLNDLWAYRELLYFFVWRDIKVRYKQTALGAAWAVIQPLFTMLVFSLFFGRLARIPS